MTSAESQWEARSTVQRNTELFHFRWLKTNIQRPSLQHASHHSQGRAAPPGSRTTTCMGPGLHQSSAQPGLDLLENKHPASGQPASQGAEPCASLPLTGGTKNQPGKDAAAKHPALIGSMPRHGCGTAQASGIWHILGRRAEGQWLDQWHCWPLPAHAVGVCHLHLTDEILKAGKKGPFPPGPQMATSFNAVHSYILQMLEDVQKALCGQRVV